MRFRLPECIAALTEETGGRGRDERIEFAGEGQFVDDTEQGARGGHDGIVEGVAGVAVCERGFGGGPGRLTHAVGGEHGSGKSGAWIPDGRVVAERANAPPGKLGGDLVARECPEAGLEGHALLPAAAALWAELALCAEEGEKGVGGEGGCDGEGEGRVERALGLCAEGGVEGEDVGAAKEVGEAALEGLRGGEHAGGGGGGHLPRCPRRRRAPWRS
jgi:hypothetical protein